MATTKDRVKVYIPRGNANEDQNYLVGVNGVIYVLPRGKESLVPPHVKEEIERSWRAQEKMDARADDLREAARKPLPGASV